MTDILLLPHTGPFVTALLVCLLMLALALTGLGGDSDAAPDVEAGSPDLDLDLEAPGGDGVPAEIQTDLDTTLEQLTGDGEAADAPDGAQAGSAGLLGTVFGFLNPGGVPMGVLIALFAGGYGVAGMLTQKLLDSLLGAPLSAALAGVALLPAGVLSTRLFGGLLGRLIPSVQTAAVREAGLKGVPARVSVGCAEIGRPARARIESTRVGDQIVNVDVVPYRDGESFPEGTAVVLLERTKTGTWIAGRLPKT